MSDSSTGGVLAPLSTPPPEDGVLDAILQTLIAGITSLPGNMVRPRWQPIPLPMPEIGTDWCALGVTEEDPMRGVMFSAHDSTGDGSTTTQTVVELTVLASFYGPTARGNAALLRDGLMLPQNRESLQLINMGLVGMPSRTTFVPELVNEKTQRRADITFRLMAPYNRVWPILNLLKAQIAVTTDRGDTQSFTSPGATP